MYGVVDREKIRSPGWSKIRSPVSEKKFVLRVGELATAILRACCRAPGLLHCGFCGPCVCFTKLGVHVS